MPLPPVLRALVLGRPQQFCALVAACVLSAPPLHAQTAEETTVLVAGFDFGNQLFPGGVFDAEFNGVRSIDATYADLTLDGFNGTATRARLKFDGTAGSSSTWTPFPEGESTPYVAVFDDTTHTSTNATIASYVRTDARQAGLIGSVYNGHFNTQNGPLGQPAPDPIWASRTYSIQFAPASQTMRFSIAADTRGVKDLRLAFAARVAAGASGVIPVGTLSWGWSVAGGPVTQLAETDPISSTSYTLVGADFSAVEALDDAADISLVVTLTGLGDASLIIDNVQLLGTALQPRTALLDPLPATVIAAAGSSASFAVGTTGANLRHQWYVGSTPVADGGRYSGATTATLTINPVEATDYRNNAYVLQVIGDVGLAGTVPGLSLRAPAAAPAITREPVDADVSLGSQVTFSVTAQSSDTSTPLTYQWYRNGSAITGNTSATTSTLILPSAGVEDRGSYFVIVGRAGSLSATSATANLIVRRTIVLAAATPPTAFLGVDYSFRPEISGATSYTYAAVGLPDGLSINSATGGVTGRATTEGTYTATITATADEFSVGSQDYVFRVTFLPVPAGIQTQPSPSTAVAGSSVVFEAVVQGVPAPSLQWFRRLPDGSVYALADSTLVTGTRTTRLQFNSVTTADAGTYFLRAANSATVDTNDVQLTVQYPPQILTQPTSLSVLAGEAATFSVAASAEPAPTFQWRRNGINIPGATGSSFSLPAATPAEAGTYTVLVANTIEGVRRETLSAAAELMVRFAPAIQVADRLDALAGEVVSIGLTVSATPTATISFTGLPAWLVYSATSGTLSGTPAPADIGSGSFTVRAANGIGPDAEATVFFAVTSQATAPAITTQPTDVAVVAGSSARFVVEATGTPTPTFQWRRDGSPLVGANRSFLELSTVLQANEGLYDVVVTNPAGVLTSRSARLSVSTPPTLTAVPVSSRFLVGETVVLTASATGTAPLTYIWTRDGTPLPGAAGPVLELGSATPALSGAYTVSVSNAVGTDTSAPFELEVGAAPVITLAARTRLLPAGGTLQIAPEVSAVPTASLRWSVDGETIVGATTAPLTLPGLRLQDAGLYAVNATNTFGSAVGQETVLAVFDPATLTVPLDGASTELRVAAPEGYSFSVTSSADWIDLSAAVEPGTEGTLRQSVVVAPNGTTTARSAELLVTLLAPSGEAVATGNATLTQRSGVRFSTDFSSATEGWTTIGQGAIQRSFAGRAHAWVVPEGASGSLLRTTPLTSETNFTLEAVVRVTRGAGARSEAELALVPARRSAARRALDAFLDGTTRADSDAVLSFSLADEGPASQTALAGRGWLRMSYLGADGTKHEFDLTQGLDRTSLLDTWVTLRVEVGAEGHLRFFAGDLLVWAPTPPAHPNVFRSRQTRFSGRSTGSLVAVSTLALTEGARASQTQLSGFERFSLSGLADGRAQGVELGFTLTSGSRRVLFRGLGSAAAATGGVAALSNAYLDIATAGTAFINEHWTYLGIPGVRDSVVPLRAAFTAAGLSDLPTTGDNTAGLLLVNEGATRAAVTGFGSAAGSATLEIVALETTAAATGRISGLSASAVLPANTPLSVPVRITGRSVNRLLVRAAAGAGRPGTLRILSGGRLLFSNSHWSTAANSAAIAAAVTAARQVPLATSGDSALLVRLDPGDYTLELTDGSGATGRASVTVLEVP